LAQAIVLHVDPVPPRLPLKGHRPHSPQISACVCYGQMAGWIKMPLGVEVGLGPGDIVLDWDSSSPMHGKGHSSPRTFRPMSIVVKRLPISATAKYNGLPTGGHGETRTKNRNSFTVSVKSNSSFTSYHSGYSYSRHSAISPLSVSSLCRPLLRCFFTPV